MKIITKKFVARGEKMREIVDIQDVPHDEELPKEYISGYPNVLKRWSNTNDLVIKKGGTSLIGGVLEIDKTYNEELFQELLKTINEAGDRLQQLRQKEKELMKIWNGTETFVIQNF